MKNKIPNVSDLIKKADYDAKIPEIENKYLPTSDYYRFTDNIFDTKISQNS